MSEKMMRVSGYYVDSEGIERSKGLKLNNEGMLETELTKNRAEIVVGDKTNPISPRTASDYEPRSTTGERFYFPHVSYATQQEGHRVGDIINIIEQTISVSSTLDAEIEVGFGVVDSTVSSVHGLPWYSTKLWDMPKGNASKKLMVLSPEKGAFSPDSESGPRTFEMLELRLPYPSFYIYIKPLTIPTVGEIKTMSVRRY